MLKRLTVAALLIAALGGCGKRHKDTPPPPEPTCVPATSDKCIGGVVTSVTSGTKGGQVLHVTLNNGVKREYTYFTEPVPTKCVRGTDWPACDPSITLK